MIDTFPELSCHDPDCQGSVLSAVVDQRHLVTAGDNMGLKLQEPGNVVQNGKHNCRYDVVTGGPIVHQLQCNRVK